MLFRTETRENSHALRVMPQEYKLDFSAVWERLITADCVITGTANRNHLVNQQGIQMEKNN